MFRYRYIFPSKNYLQTEVLELVAKTVVTNEYLVSIFQPTITSIKENAYYSKLIPAMKKIQDEHNIPESKQINIFVKCIGCRHSLDKGTLSTIIKSESEKHKNVFNKMWCMIEQVQKREI